MSKIKIALISILLILPLKLFPYSGEVKTLIQKGTKYLFNLEQKKTLQTFTKLLKIKPKHPVSYFYVAFAYFIMDLNSFEKKAKLDKLKDLITRGNYYAKKIKNPDKYDKLYILAMRSLYGFLKFRQGNYASAISIAIELLYRVRELHKIYPNFADGNIGMGVVHMIITQIPGTLKMILAMINFKGEHKKAVSFFKQTIKHGQYFNDAARGLLAFYKVFFLKDLKGSLKILNYLKGKYPKNFFFYLNIIYAYFYNRKYAKCLNLIRSYKNELADKLINSNYEWRFRFDFIEARIYFEFKKYKKSLNLFQSVIKKRVNKWTRDFYCVYSILYRGMIYDVTNRRGLALNSYYLLSRNLEKRFQRAKDYAKKFIDKAFKEKDPRVYKKKKKRKVTLN